MKKTRLFALVLAGAVSLSLLTACGGNSDPTPTPDEATPTPVTETTATPEANPTPEATQPDESVTPSEPVESDTPTPEAKELTAAEVYALVSAAAGGSSMMDASFALDSYYPALTEADFADFVLYVPEASANIEEILVAKVAAGKLDTVKKACESRIQGIKEDAEMYASTGAYVDSYKLVTEGDWLLFCVCEKPADAVKAFQDAVK